ncbi:MAG: gliding motility-associated C-terminal domain-containing protein [Cyclobacteriaceae bacterium]
MKRFLLFITVFILWYTTEAFHIVGGEISFETIRPGLYRITLIQYYDEAQTDNNTYDAFASVHMFSNKDGSTKAIINLARRRISNVPYSNIKCVIDELKTSKVEYSGEFSLEPQDFADPEGYYISWERCCRNVSVDNLVNPTGAGMNYVAEIPPLYKNGAPFINSSPALFRPLGDYACINQFYYVNFTGIDPDGDSLSYRMVTPLNSSATFPPAPTPQPKPHIPVRFLDGYSKDISIKGSPALGINDAGLLTVKPSETGLFVFSVLVEEWRDGEKLGEVQRDFQMLVVDGCEPPDPPEVAVRIPGDPDFNTEVDILSYSVSDEKCFEYLVTNIEEGEEIFFRAELSESAEEMEGVFEITSTFVDAGEDTLLVTVCAPDCPPIRDRPFDIDLIASDDACPLPQMDTVRITLDIEPPPNEFPVITPGDNSYFVNEGDLFSLDISGVDADNDSMDMFIVVDGVEDPETIGLTLDVLTSEAGNISGTLYWDTDCLEYDFEDAQQFNVRVFVDDRDSCMVMNPDHLFLSMNVVLPPNTSPSVTTDVTEYHVNPTEEVTFDVRAMDDDGDSITLRMVTPDFDPNMLGVLFSDTAGTGEIMSQFQWDINCAASYATGKTQFQFLFLGEDFDPCKVNNEDTLAVLINVDFEPNSPPRFHAYGDHRIKIGQPFSLDITASDNNPENSLTVRFLQDAFRPDSPGLSFPTQTGTGSVTSTLTWTPECELLDLNETSTFIELAFEVFDDGCPIPSADTLRLQFELYDDRVSFNEFLPPNAFSPNGDGINDVFSLSNLGEASRNLPGDNCMNTFEYVNIFDRNGKSVFRTNQRDFNWSGGDVPSGIYFYVVKYSQREYKGYLRVLR